MTRPLATLLCLLLSACASHPPAAAPDFAATYRRHAVAADHPLASAAGLEALRAGGNAVDAAVATSFALSVVRPFSCGIGGGGFMVIHFAEPTHPTLPRYRHNNLEPMIQWANPPRHDFAINYREMAPAAASADMFAQPGQPTGAASLSRTGGLAPAIPGTVAGLLHAHQLYGHLTREEVLAPAIRLAESGFAADDAYVRAVNSIAADYAANPDWQTRFAFAWERYLHHGHVAVGDLIHVPEQAAALRLIARDGAAAFYDGPIADAIVRAVQADGGIMTRDDLRTYRVQDAEPLTFTAMGRRFLTMPPPSSGGITMAQTLGILERLDHHFGRESWNQDTHAAWRSRLQPRAPSDTVAALLGSGLSGAAMLVRDHLLIESFQFASADRAAWLGDPDFVDIPLDRLLSPDYLDGRAARVDPAGTPQPPEHYLDPAAGAELLADDHGTSHLSVVDRWGNAVACTETINLEFGSLLAVPEYGFILNDQMDDFTSRVGEPNAFGLRQSARNLPAPGKRPLSSMTPTIVLDAAGEVEVVAGASGGPRIITGTTLAILHALNGWSAREAVAAPRFHHQWMPARLDMEPQYAALDWWRDSHADPQPMATGMAERGYEVRPIDRLCVVQLIRRDGEQWQAASDPRKGGRPAGD